MGKVYLFEVKYQRHKIKADDEAIAEALERNFEPVMGSFVGGSLYSISAEHIDQILRDDDNRESATQLTSRERETLEAMKRRAEELGGGFDLLWT